MSLTDIEKRILEINEQKTKNTKLHNEFIKTCDEELLKLNDQKSLLLKDLNIEKIETARKCILVWCGTNEKLIFSDLVKLAIQDLITGCKKMKYEYFGAKNYDRWFGQRSDHKYGYGPAHGSCIFSIELREPQRELTPEEIECCLYYLNNIFVIHDDVIQKTTS